MYIVEVKSVTHRNVLFLVLLLKSGDYRVVTEWDNGQRWKAEVQVSRDAALNYPYPEGQDAAQLPPGLFAVMDDMLLRIKGEYGFDLTGTTEPPLPGDNLEEVAPPYAKLFAQLLSSGIWR
jgi:hypothetical protein